MKLLLSSPSILAASLGLAMATAHAEVKLPSLLSAHAVLQKSDHTQIWGKADPGEKIKVSIGLAKAETSAGTDGKWNVGIDVSRVGEGPFELVVEGNNRVVVPDVIIGDVWVCGGQSNMAFPLPRARGAAEEIPQSANPMLRQFTDLGNASSKPEDECKGSWIVAKPETVADFSAAGYFFAKNVYQKLRQPIGLIVTARAGTFGIQWVPTDTINENPEWKSRIDTMVKDAAEYPAAKERYLSEYRQWLTQNNRTDHPADPALYAAPDAPVNDWKKVALPSTLKAAGLPDSGAVWFRKTFTLPPGPVKPAMFQLGAVRDLSTFYVNGKKVNEVTIESMYSGFDVRCRIPDGLLHEGENTFAVRLFTPADGAAMPSTLFLQLGLDRSLFNGEWLAKVEFELPALPAEARKAIPVRPQNRGTDGSPGFLFNGIIHPLMASTIKGVLWYHGEQDTGRPSEYLKIFEAIVQGWRKGWGSEFPFYYCQLPNCNAKKDVPGKSQWAELREAQSKAQTLPNTGQAVLIDLGEEDVHPVDKKEVGERLARIALARTYKQDIVDSGPVYGSMKIENDKIRLSFASNGGLVAKPLPAEYQPTNMSPALKPLVRHSPDGELEGFEICGSDKKWVWATAKIEKDTVVVSSPAVPSPVAVRYAWADNPTCNLYNRAGLPESPFQTEQMK